MIIVYEIFEQLLQERSVTAYRVCKDLGLSQSTITAWKNGEYTPKQEKLQKIAEYFSVPIDYLLTGKPEYKSFSLRPEILTVGDNENTDELAQRIYHKVNLNDFYDMLNQYVLKNTIGINSDGKYELSTEEMFKIVMEYIIKIEQKSNEKQDS